MDKVDKLESKVSQNIDFKVSQIITAQSIIEHSSQSNSKVEAQNDVANASNDVIDYYKSVDLTLEQHKYSDDYHGFEEHAEDGLQVNDQMSSPRGIKMQDGDDGLQMVEHQSVINEILKQVKEAQDLLQQKVEQNKELRDKLEEYQHKYSTLFQEKTDIHEQLLKQKQLVIEMKEKQSQLQIQHQDEQNQLINISGGGSFIGGGSFVGRGSFITNEALDMQSQNMADMKYQMKLKEEQIGKLQQEINQIHDEYEKSNSDLHKDYVKQKQEIKELKETIVCATVQMEAQRNCIASLRREQRMATALVHSFGLDVLKGSDGGQPVNAPQRMPNQ